MRAGMIEALRFALGVSRRARSSVREWRDEAGSFGPILRIDRATGGSTFQVDGIAAFLAIWILDPRSGRIGSRDRWFRQY